MNTLGNGLCAANHHEDALSVQEALLSVNRRLGAPGAAIVLVLSNLAGTYQSLGRYEQALRMRREVYLVRVKFEGEEHEGTLREAYNYAAELLYLRRFDETKSVICKMMPVARRVLGDSHEITLLMRWTYATALYEDDAATLDDQREAVATLADAERIARRVLGGAPPTTVLIGRCLRASRAVLRARETPPPPSPAGSV